MVSALGRHEVSEYLLVRMETDQGIEGAGEATVMSRWSGETVWTAKTIIDNVIAPHLIGADPFDVPRVDSLIDQATQCNWFAKSAVEMACWDIRGKAENVPVYRLLGGPKRPLAIRCRFSMGAYPPERARQRTKELTLAGFTTIKVKVGTKLEEDVERVRIVRETMGPDLDLVIDANCGYDAPTAIKAAERMETYNVGLFEQPTPRSDFHGLAEVRRAIKPLVMADDICFDFYDAVECIRHEACDVISVYPGKNGGIRKAKRIVDYASEHKIACSIGSNLELDIASAAMCHLVVACENMNVEKFPGDILGPEYHEFSVVKNPLKIEGPVITLNDEPGLGVTVDWDLVRANAIA